MKKILILFCFSILSSVAFAQKSGSIAGNLTANQEPIEFATITLSKLPDATKIVYFTSSDSLGHFSFENINLGNYLMKVSLIGYKTFIQNITLSEQNSPYFLKDLMLSTDDKLLNEVVVTSQKKLIEKTTEGFIVNANTNITQLGGTATDLLKNTPTVSVDAEGVITLRGKTPSILINGRNSNLANTDQIPASSIESIEIINSASAKYDANAESGIINIKLKKNTQNGTNGAIAIGGGMGSRERANSALLINHKTDKWNVGVGYDNRFAGRTKHITSNRTNFNLSDKYYINQDRNDERVERLQNLKLNVDFAPNEKNTFAFEAIGNLEGQDNDEFLNSIILKQNNNFNTGNNRHSWEYKRSKVAEFAMNYNRKYDNPQKALSASITSSIENGKENTDISTQNIDGNANNIGAIFWQRTHNYENGIISNAKVDYTLPISEKGILETGYKGIFRSIKTDFEMADKVENSYVINSASSNIFNFNEQVHAVYALYHSYFGTAEQPKVKYELGLRAEQVNNNGETQNNSTHFTNNYLKLFPTANISYFINADEFWKLSYGKRINRPGLGQLNPFVDITDALNPHSGNPNLKPEIIDAIEISYNKEWDKISLSSNVFYRHANNTIRNFFISQNDGTVLNLPNNIGSSDSYGLENIFTAKPTDFYDLNASISLFQQKLNGSNVSSDAIQSSFNWYGKLINNFAVSKGGKLQIIANYNSAATTPQGRLIALYNVDLGFQQKLGKGNTRLGLVVVDVFNTLKSGSKNFTNEFTSNRSQKADTRAVMLTLAYTFKSAFKEKLLDNKFSKEF
ncbi:outer membrane beta-barrel family protein [Arcicella rosea]|uniref:Outer membrane receptor protein involved in Fe transport n=1 Tax=Arcicella rosea TaxID=502909 RepID=A0A841ER67_9BACT|nr:outer membrane beta-barrel family protein [Arcicella rosea]MBB6005436.1 outer membrane receptor protein involved in Fe transport [Arcicella rosea]